MERRYDGRHGSTRDTHGQRQGSGGEVPGRTTIKGEAGKNKFNTQLFAAALIGGGIGFVLDLILCNALYGSLPNIVLFGIVMMLFSLGVLGGAAVCSSRYNVDFGKAIVVALVCAVIFFLVSMLFEFIYEWDFSGKKKVVTKTVSVTDYIFCIDDSGSMDTNDPDNQRYAAMDNILGQLDESNNVGMIRFAGRVFAKCDPAPLNNKQIETIDKTINDNPILPFGLDGTDFEDPLNTASDMYDRLGISGRNQIVVLLSDGEADLDVDAMAAEYNKAGITICTVFLGESTDIPPVLAELADLTGGSSVRVSEADKLIDTFQDIVKTTNKVSTDTGEYTRFLWSARTPADQANALKMIERILFFTVFGLMFGMALYVMLGSELKWQRFISLGEGFLCGVLLEAGFYLGGSDPLTRIFTLVMALVFAKYMTVGSVGYKRFDGEIEYDEYRTGEIGSTDGLRIDDYGRNISADNFTRRGEGERRDRADSGASRYPGGGRDRYSGRGSDQSYGRDRGGRSGGSRPGGDRPGGSRPGGDRRRS